MSMNVLLYSGGMDSFCLSKLYKFNKILFFITGTLDNHKELLQLYRAIEHGVINENGVEIINFPLSKYELENKIIPHRNSLFCLIASNYGNHIYIGTTIGDTTKDKDYVFKSQMEGILNYFGLDKHKNKDVGYPYQIIMPFKNLTKTQILHEYVSKGNSINDLLNYSRSCYTNADLECGVCRSCLRKAVALQNNNIDYHEIFNVDPLGVSLSSSDITKMKTRMFEWEDYQQAMMLHD